MKRRNNIIKDGKQSQCTDKGKVLGLTINRRGIEPHIKEIKIKALGALTDLYHFKNLQTNMNLHLIKIQDNTDSVIPTDTTCHNQQNKYIETSEGPQRCTQICIL